MLDRIDKEIIRFLLKYTGKFLTTNQIAKKVGISPLTAKRHLEKLARAGYVESKYSEHVREYEWKERIKRR